MVALDQRDPLAAILHRFGPDPAHHLRAPVDVKEAIRLVQPPRANDETFRRAIAAFSHTSIVAKRQTTDFGRVAVVQRGGDIP